jgi:hypothetical protein
MNVLLREKMTDPKFRVSLIGAVLFALLALFIGGVVLATLELTHATMVFGPGFYPLLLSVLMFVSCLVVIYNLLFGNTEQEVTKLGFSLAAARKPVLLAGLTVILFAAMPLLGFIGAMFLFCMIEMTYLEPEKEPLMWRIIYSAAISGGVYWLFYVLTVFLPVPFWWSFWE